MFDSDYYKDVLDGLTISINKKDGQIMGIVKSLTNQEEVSSSISNGVSPIVVEDAEPVEGVVLDEEWFEQNFPTLEENGWYTEVKSGDTLYCVELPDGKVVKYNPRNKKLISDGKSETVTMKIYGDIKDITGTVTTIKANRGSNPGLPESSTCNKLVIVYGGDMGQGDDCDRRTDNFIYHSTMFGNMLATSSGNKNPQSNNLVGFSQGGLCAMYIMGDPTRAKLYDKVTLINISPNAGADECYRNKTLEGKTVEIIQTYNNHHSGRDGTKDYYTNQKGGPYLDKLLAAGANVIVTVPDPEYDKYSFVTELVDYAKNLESEYPDSLRINTFTPSDYDIKAFNNNDTSHEMGRYSSGGRSLLDYYLTGDTGSINELK